MNVVKELLIEDTAVGVKNLNLIQDDHEMYLPLSPSIHWPPLPPL